MLGKIVNKQRTMIIIAYYQYNNKSNVAFHFEIKLHKSHVAFATLRTE